MTCLSRSRARTGILIGTALCSSIGLLTACVEGAECRSEGVTYADGETWVADNCDVCECENGITYCEAMDCIDTGDPVEDSGS